MANDDLAKQAVTTVLGGGELQKIKPFSVGAFQLNPLFLKTVGGSVTSGDIKVKFDDQKYKGWAEYDSATDTFYLGFTAASALTQKALIVHESTHAYFDLTNASKMKVVDSEAAAYLAKCQFARAHNSNPSDRLMSDDAAKDKVFEIGWDIAGKLLGGTTPTTAEIDSLRYAVSKHPFYRSDSGKLARFNGVAGSSKTPGSGSGNNIWSITYEEIAGTKHFQIFPGSSVSNGTQSILQPANSKAILRVSTQSDGTLALENTSLGNAPVAVVVASTLVKFGYRLVSGPLADQLSDDFGNWRAKSRKPKLTDLVFPQLHFK